MKVSKENCKGCPTFEHDVNQDNMLKFDVCHRRDSDCCDKIKEDKTKKIVSLTTNA